MSPPLSGSVKRRPHELSRELDRQFRRPVVSKRTSISGAFFARRRATYLNCSACILDYHWPRMRMGRAPTRYWLRRGVSRQDAPGWHRAFIKMSPLADQPCGVSASRFELRRCQAWLIRLAFATSLLAGTVTVPAYTALVAFGDSYTDTGRLPSTPPQYWNGRFSNGPLWLEYLSQTLGFDYNPANNFAVSGTESTDLGTEISGFPGTSDSQNVLFAIWSGNNDFGNHLNIGVNDAAWDTRINSIVSSLMTASDLLYQKGARNIILFNQIELSRVPYILNTYSPSFCTYLAEKIQIFNNRLAQNVPGLLASHPDLQVFLIDAHSDLDYLLDSYAALGFTHTTISALDDHSLIDKSFSGPGADYVFWDSQHPTTKTHGLLAKWVANVLPAQTPPPPPPTVAITTPTDGEQFAAPAGVSIDASVTANGWSINQVQYLLDGAVVGQANSPPFGITLPSVLDGTHTLSVQASYGSGQTITSTPIQITVAPPTGPPPPAPWEHRDIGSVGLPGGASYSSGRIFAITGSGSDIWGTADAFQYVSRSCAGDATLIARIAGLQDTDGFAKAGLMFRQSLDPGAPCLMCFITPSSGTGFQSRTSSGGLSSYTQGPSAVAPFWLKLQRIGDTFYGYASPDGNNWTVLGSITIPMPKSLYAGLAVTSHNNARLNTATVDHVQLLLPTAPPSTALPPKPPRRQVPISVN